MESGFHTLGGAERDSNSTMRTWVWTRVRYRPPKWAWLVRLILHI